MDYNEAKTRLKFKIIGDGDKLNIPTLGKRSSFNVQFKNVDGSEFIEVRNSKITSKIVDEQIWDTVVNRYNSLLDEGNLIPSNYTAEKWTSKDGNLDTVFSPYIAALVFYLKS